MGRGQHTISKGVKMPLVGCQYPRDRGVDIPWLGGSIYHG